MVRWRTLVFSLMACLLLASCGQQTPSEAAPTPAATANPLPPAAPTADAPLAPEPAPAEGQVTVSGEFEIDNTSADVPEVLVETMEMVFEYQPEPASPWERVAAACTFVPTVPILVREKQAVRYDCQLQGAQPPDAQLRATVEIRLLGSEDIFRLEVEQ